MSLGDRICHSLIYTNVVVAPIVNAAIYAALAGTLVYLAVSQNGN